MGSYKTDQSGSSVGGDQAGRDIHKNYYDGKPTAMSSLIDKYESEVEEGNYLNSIIDELQHLTEPSDIDVRGLQDKLETSGRSDAVQFALYFKEMAAKELLRLPNVQSAQKIYSLVLAEMWASFHLKVVPLIQEGRPRTEVDAAIKQNVVDPAFELLETNPMCLNHSHILGLFYFLAGNCHVSWDK